MLLRMLLHLFLDIHGSVIVKCFDFVDRSFVLVVVVVVVAVAAFVAVVLGKRQQQQLK